MLKNINKPFDFCSNKLYFINNGNSGELPLILPKDHKLIAYILIRCLKINKIVPLSLMSLPLDHRCVLET